MLRNQLVQRVVGSEQQVFHVGCLVRELRVSHAPPPCELCGTSILNAESLFLNSHGPNPNTSVLDGQASDSTESGRPHGAPDNSRASCLRPGNPDLRITCAPRCSIAG